MFNSITSDHIKYIPDIGGVDREHLPQMLSKIYAQILGLKTKYAGDDLQFTPRELEEDYNLLSKLSISLEVYLESGKFEDMRSSIAYVAALSRKLLGKLSTEHDMTMSLYDVPSDIISVLLFIIGEYFADAEEQANLFLKTINVDNVSCQETAKAICFLANGKLLKIRGLHQSHRNFNSIEDEAAGLMWDTLTDGVKDLAQTILDNSASDCKSYFKKVAALSVYKHSYQDTQIDYILSGPNRVARLLLIASDVLIRHSLIQVLHMVEQPEWETVVKKMVEKRPYLWRNHLLAIQNGFLTKGTSSVVTFPTGAGKSTLVELKIAQAVLQGDRVVYIVPTHALEYQVIRNVSKLLGIKEPDDLNFGPEFTTLEEDDSPVWIMTPERCSTLMTLNPSRFDDVSLIVMDEFHIISSKDRGGDHRALGAMICLLSFFYRKPDADYVLISAMVENGEEISEWVSEVTGRNCLNLDLAWKPTSQLQGCLMYDQRELNDLMRVINVYKNEGRTKDPGKKVKEQMRVTPYCLFSLNSLWDPNNMDDFYKVPLLDKQVKLDAVKGWKIGANKNEVSMQLAGKFAALGMKTIVFVDKPSVAQGAAKKISDLNLREAKPTRSDLKLIISIGKELGGYQYSFITPHMSVAVHHSYLLPEERRLMESFFKNTVDIMTATPTLSQGVNLPVDVVIIAGEYRFDMETGSMEMISADQILNATGRAGRAGFSSQGAAILVPSYVIGYGDEPNSQEWHDITTKIFAKGDQCIKVDDPVNKLLADYLETHHINSIQRNALLKINNFKEDGPRLFSNALFAYRFRKINRENRVERRINQLLGLASSLGEDEVEEPWMKEISFKTGVDISIIRDFYQYLKDSDIGKIASFSLFQLIDYYCSWLSKSPELLEQLICSKRTIMMLRKLLEYREDQPITENGIIKMKKLLSYYVDGRTLFDIDELLINTNTKRPENLGQLLKARTFVLKGIPMISYALSALSMCVIEYALYRGISEESISDEVKNFATYLKEGVTSRTMYNYKRKSHMMRVEVHQKFNVT